MLQSVNNRPGCEILLSNSEVCLGFCCRPVAPNLVCGPNFSVVILNGIAPRMTSSERTKAFPRLPRRTFILKQLYEGENQWKQDYCWNFLDILRIIFQTQLAVCLLELLSVINCAIWRHTNRNSLDLRLFFSEKPYYM